MPMEINSKAYHYIETDEDSFSVSLSDSETENAACGSDEERSALGFHVIGRAEVGSNTPIMICLVGNRCKTNPQYGAETRYITIAQALNMINALHAGVRAAMRGEKDE